MCGFLLLITVLGYCPGVALPRGQYNLDPGHFCNSSPCTFPPLQLHRPPCCRPLLTLALPRGLCAACLSVLPLCTGLVRCFIQGFAQMPPPQRGLSSLPLLLSTFIFLGGPCHHVTLMKLVASCLSSKRHEHSALNTGASPAPCGCPALAD